MNPYAKIAIAAIGATYLAPMIQRRFVVPTFTPGDETKQDVTLAGIFGLVTAGVFVVLGMATGGGKVAA